MFQEKSLVRVIAAVRNVGHNGAIPPLLFRLACKPVNRADLLFVGNLLFTRSGRPLAGRFPPVRGDWAEQKGKSAAR